MQERVEVPCDAADLPRGCWFDALVGVGGQAQRRLIKGSGCFAISLRSGTDEVDLRTSDKLFVEIKASSAEGLAEGAQRVRRAIADVLQAHGVAPKTPPQPPEAVEEPVFVLPSAPSGPPPSWGVAPPAPPPQAPALADEALAEQSCGLCMADVTANVRMEPCSHYACVSCVANLRRRALFVSTAGVPCPYCRTIIVRYDAPPGVDVGLQPAAAPEQSLALRATLPPLEIRRPPPAAVVTKASREAQAPVHPKHKTMLCSRWTETGTCDYGLRCHFAHGEAELRRDPARDYSRDYGAGSASASWRAAATGTSNDVSPPRAERAHVEPPPAPAAAPPAAPAPAPPAPPAPEPVVEPPPRVLPDEAPPAPAAAAPPGLPSWLVQALGAQQSSVPPAAAPAAAPVPAAPPSEASLVGTPWELILQLDDNGF